MSNLKNAPFSRNEAGVLTLSFDTILALIPAIALACFQTGMRALLVCGVSVLAAVFFEYIGCLIGEKRVTLSDGTAVITGLIIAMLLPACVPLFVPVLANAFAVLIVKLPFGGSGHNLFNPAAAGIAFVTQCFSQHVFSYPALDTKVPFAIFPQDVVTAPSPAGLLKAGGTTPYAWYEFLIGQVTGSIGAVAILVICAGAVYLFVRRSAAPLLTLSCLGTAALIAVLSPRVENITWYQSILFELCSGYLVFGAVFMLNDPVTSPRHPLAHVFYGVMVGTLTMWMRHVGPFEEGFCFALLICNAFSNVLDRFAWQILRPRRQRRKEREEA